MFTGGHPGSASDHERDNPEIALRASVHTSAEIFLSQDKTRFASNLPVPEADSMLSAKRYRGESLGEYLDTDARPQKITKDASWDTRDDSSWDTRDDSNWDTKDASWGTWGNSNHGYDHKGYSDINHGYDDYNSKGDIIHGYDHKGYSDSNHGYNDYNNKGDNNLDTWDTHAGTSSGYNGYTWGDSECDNHGGWHGSDNNWWQQSNSWGDTGCNTWGQTGDGWNDWGDDADNSSGRRSLVYNSTCWLMCFTLDGRVFSYRCFTLHV